MRDKVNSVLTSSLKLMCAFPSLFAYLALKYFFFFPSCPSLFYSYFLSAFSNLQISMSVKKAQTSVTGASVQTHQGLISVCALMASCHPRIWRPAWVTDVLFIAQIKHCNHTNCSSALIRSRGFSHLLKLHNEHLQGYPRYESWE